MTTKRLTRLLASTLLIAGVSVTATAMGADPALTNREISDLARRSVGQFPLACDAGPALVNTGLHVMHAIAITARTHADARGMTVGDVIPDKFDQLPSVKTAGHFVLQCVEFVELINPGHSTAIEAVLAVFVSGPHGQHIRRMTTKYIGVIDMREPTGMVWQP